MKGVVSVRRSMTREQRRRMRRGQIEFVLILLICLILPSVVELVL